jgi:hypothetical protein
MKEAEEWIKTKLGKQFLKDCYVNPYDLPSILEQYAQQTAEAAWVAAKMNVAAFMPRGDDYKALTFDEWYTNHQNQQ